MSLKLGKDAVTHLVDDIAAAERYAQEGANHSKNWWLARLSGLRHALDLINEERERDNGSKPNSVDRA